MNDVFAKADLTGAGPGDTRQCPGSEPVLGLPCGLCRVSREIPIVRMYFYVFREPVKKIKVENSTLGLIRQIMMGEGNGVASVIMFTFTKKLGPYVHTACEARPLCSHSLGCPAPMFTQLVGCTSI